VTTGRVDPRGELARALSEAMRRFGGVVGDVNVTNGWDTSRGMLADPDAYDPRWQTSHKVAELGLIMTEASEAIEEVRAGHAMTHTYYRASDGKPEGVPSELADVVIRALDIADAYGIDLGAAMVEKLNHNATRGRHHGGKAI
jgi:NTP pyrophosphatase (non-canonical NTP hydrolase)